jgi:hypothetical protein
MWNAECDVEGTRHSIEGSKVPQVPHEESTNGAFGAESFHVRFAEALTVEISPRKDSWLTITIYTGDMAEAELVVF